MEPCFWISRAWISINAFSLSKPTLRSIASFWGQRIINQDGASIVSLPDGRYRRPQWIPIPIALETTTTHSTANMDQFAAKQIALKDNEQMVEECYLASENATGTEYAYRKQRRELKYRLNMCIWEWMQCPLYIVLWILCTMCHLFLIINLSLLFLLSLGIKA